MSKVLRVIGMIAGAVLLIASGVGLIGGKALAATLHIAGIKAWAGLVAGVALVGSALLAKPPPSRGSVTQVVISPEAPMPYVMGEGLVAGVLRYQRSYGATLDKVPNPYRFMAIVYTGGGPVESISPRVDQTSVSSWFSGFLYTDTQLGACPEADALAPQWAGAPGWGSTSKLSGKAAIGWSLKFDKKGKVFASGMPQLGAYGRWVKVYDPRADSTFPGGSGSQRVDDESTWTWSENPALHAGTYALGRYQNGKRVIGVGLPADAIDWTNIAAWANVCEANGWTLFGQVFEPGDAQSRYANLRDIAVAGGAEPILASDGLRFHYQAPGVALDTITAADLAEDGEHQVTAMAPWATRTNTILPKYRSPDHNWELVQADAVSVSSYVTEDGEVKQAEWPFNFVKSVDQAAQLARYQLENSREIQPIVLECNARLRAYRPGDRLTLDLNDELGLATDAVILKREFDPARMTVKLTLIGETDGKHAYALGETGTAPPTPALSQTSQERDELAFFANSDAAVEVSVVADRTVAADYTGAVAAGDLAAVIWSPRIYQSGASIKTDDDTSYALSNASGGTFAVDNTLGSATKGDVTISAMSSLSAQVDLTVTVAGVTSPRITLRLSKVLASAPALGTVKTVSWSTGDFTGIDSTSYLPVVSAVRTVELASGESLYGTAPLDYRVEGTTFAIRTMTFKWQYAVAGSGSWSDFGGTVTGSVASSDRYLFDELVDGSPGSVAVTQTKSGLSAGSYDVRLVAITSTTGRVCTPDGLATVQAKV